MRKSRILLTIVAIVAVGLLTLRNQESKMNSSSDSRPTSQPEIEKKNVAALRAISDFTSNFTSEPNLTADKSLPPKSNSAGQEEKNREVVFSAEKLMAKAVRSKAEKVELEKLWQEPRFGSLLLSALADYKKDGTPIESEREISMMKAVNTLILGLQNSASRPNAESLLLKYLEETTIEGLTSAGAHPTVLAAVSENQAELLYHYPNQQKIAALNQKSPSAVRLKILANVERHHGYNESMSRLELE
jgi:hypothetical protein